MKVRTTYRQKDSTDALKEYVDQKLQKLKRHLAEPAEVRAVLSVERYLHSAEFSVSSKKFNARIQEQKDDMYASIDTAVDRIEKAARRHKEKKKKR